MSEAFTLFAKKVGREGRIPCTVVCDPFYSERNLNYLRRLKKKIEAGQAHFAQHDLIEVSALLTLVALNDSAHEGNVVSLVLMGALLW